MEEGTKAKKTIFVGNIADDVDEAVLLETFNAFGDILDVQIPPAANNPNQQTEEHHKGYGFVTFSSPADAQDAIDNMDLNELKGKVLRVNLARPSAKISTQGMGNRAIWESEEWLQQHAKPLGKSGGAALRAQAGSGSAPAPDESENKDDADDDNAMAE